MRTSAEALSYPQDHAQDVEEAIRRRAYEIYRQRHAAEGNPEDDWLQAQAEILNSDGDPS